MMGRVQYVHKRIPSSKSELKEEIEHVKLLNGLITKSNSVDNWRFIAVISWLVVAILVGKFVL